MHNDTKQLIKDKIADLVKQIDAAQIVEDAVKVKYDVAKANTTLLKEAKQNLKDDLPV